jgi:hypothetical protein
LNNWGIGHEANGQRSRKLLFPQSGQWKNHQSNPSNEDANANEVVQRMHRMARQQKANPGLAFLDRNDQPVRDEGYDDDDDDDDDNEDESYHPNEALLASREWSHACCILNNPDLKRKYEMFGVFIYFYLHRDADCLNYA